MLVEAFIASLYELVDDERCRPDLAPRGMVWWRLGAPELTLTIVVLRKKFQ